jgi:hypothetical protein
MHMPNHPQQVIGQAGRPVVRPNWWSRNWVWVMAATLAIILLAFGGVFLGVKSVMAGAMQTMEVYRRPIVAAQDSPWVQSQIGSPVSVATLDQTRGRVNMQNGRGEADLAIPIYGPRGSATIHAEARRVGGRWEYSRMVVEVDATGEWRDLLR